MPRTIGFDMSYLFGDVVLVPFPFSDQQGIKRRPAVIISSAAYNLERRDVLIMAITSRLRIPPNFGELLVDDWESAGLIKPSVFKPVLTTIEQALVLRTMGHLSAPDEHALRALLSTITG